MAELTKEQLQEIAETDHVQCGDAAAMARQLLAGLEQEPVATFYKSECGNVFNTLDSWLPVEGVNKLYAAPQLPQPAVDQKDVESLATDLMKRIDKITGERHSVATLSSLRVSIVEACRAAVLQGAEPVSQPYTLHDGWVAVPVEMTPEQMRAVQLNSELGAYTAANLSGAYSLFREFWGVAIAAAPKQEEK